MILSQQKFEQDFFFVKKANMPKNSVKTKTNKIFSLHFHCFHKNDFSTLCIKTTIDEKGSI